MKKKKKKKDEYKWKGGHKKNKRVAIGKSPCSGIAPINRNKYEVFGLKFGLFDHFFNEPKAMC